MSQYTIISIHLGKPEIGEARKAALERIAEREGCTWNGCPSIGKWLNNLADKEIEEMATEKIFATLKEAGYEPGDITRNTFLYTNGRNENTVMEKPDRQSMPIDWDGNYGASYVDSLEWSPGSKIAAAEAAGGKAAATRVNLAQARKEYQVYRDKK